MLRQLNPALKGWCVYFRPGVSSETFAYLTPLHVASGRELVAPQTPPVHLAGPAPPLLRRPSDDSRPRRKDRCSTPRR
ncbi:group II intron maturase-specific domain-containing protein [Streptomyces chrestomyceticus]|uniref:group II intron maturase-specific domain-containing protein n=1 Tax=Streptomyces chrestomyceticus TaxID=68185 RepID=UPI0036C4BE20